MSQEQFSQYLRRKRRELGLSQEDLADTAGFSTNYIAKLETGIREPGLKALKRLADALRVPRSEIINASLESWPEATQIEPITEFKEFPEHIQDFLVEVGFLFQKYSDFYHK